MTTDPSTWTDDKLNRMYDLIVKMREEGTLITNPERVNEIVQEYQRRRVER